MRRLGLAILAFAGSWLLWPQRSNQSCGSSEYRAESLRQATRQANWTRNAGIIASLAFVVAAAGAYFGWRALALTQQQTVEANRAWVDPAELKLTSPLESNDPPSFQLLIQNTGRAPALGLAYKFHIFTVPYISSSKQIVNVGENESCLSLKPDQNKGSALFPDSAHHWIPEQTPVDDRLGRIKSDVLARRLSLVIEGCVVYVTFGKPRYSQFRFFLRDTPGPSCWAAREGVITAAGIMDCWHFNVMLSGNAAD